MAAMIAKPPKPNQAMQNAANEGIVGFHTRYGFRRLAPEEFRMFLPAASLEGDMLIPLE